MTDDDKPQTSEPPPHVREDRESHRFEALVDGAVAGYVEYHQRGTARSLLHTVVDPAYEGRGIGSALARYALDATRAAGLQVLPYCPFIRSYLERHPELLDLVPAQRREEFGLPAD